MYNERYALLASLEGLIPERVGLRLAELAAAVPGDLAIVEIGSYKGKSTSYLAAGASSPEGDKAHVYAIDPWDSEGNKGGRFGFNQPQVRTAFEDQIRRAGVDQFITPIRGYSCDVAIRWDRPIGLLYIDGSHTEQDVRNDIEAWQRHLASGAVVVFDDYATERNPGVAVVVHQVMQKRFGVWDLSCRPIAIGRDIAWT